MARDIGALSPELAKFSIRTTTLVYLDWHTKDDTGSWKPTPLYLTNSAQNVVHAGITYQALGNLANISSLEEGFELQSYGIELTLSGISPQFMAQAFNDISFSNAYTNRPAKIYTAFLDENYSVVDSPVLIFAGQMDAINVAIDEEVSISLSVQSRLIDWEKPRGGRFNEETQQVRYPLDTGFQYVAQIQDAEISYPGGIFDKGIITLF